MKFGWYVLWLVHLSPESTLWGSSPSRPDHVWAEPVQVPPDSSVHSSGNDTVGCWEHRLEHSDYQAETKCLGSPQHASWQEEQNVPIAELNSIQEKASWCRHVKICSQQDGWGWEAAPFSGLRVSLAALLGARHWVQLTGVPTLCDQALPTAAAQICSQVS